MHKHDDQIETQVSSYPPGFIKWFTERWDVTVKPLRNSGKIRNIRLVAKTIV